MGPLYLDIEILDIHLYVHYLDIEIVFKAVVELAACPLSKVEFRFAAPNTQPKSGAYGALRSLQPQEI